MFMINGSWFIHCITWIKKVRRLKLDITLSKSILLLQNHLNSAPLRRHCSGTPLTGRHVHTLNSLVRHYDIDWKNDGKNHRILTQFWRRIFDIGRFLVPWAFPKRSWGKFVKWFEIEFWDLGLTDHVVEVPLKNEIISPAETRMFVMSKDGCNFLQRRRPAEVDCVVTVSLAGEWSVAGRRDLKREILGEIGPWKWLISKDLLVNRDI
jgi:hypothetical protein